MLALADFRIREKPGNYYAVLYKVCSTTAKKKTQLVRKIYIRHISIQRSGPDK